MKVWEILVPTEMERVINGNKVIKPISTRYHRIWDEKVRAISKGLTILNPTKGQWISSTGRLFVERMIPVRIACTKDEIMAIARMTMDYYNQEAVLVYLISEEVMILNRQK